VVVRSVAEAEIAETWDDYEEIRPSLAEDFLEKVAAALARAAEHSYAFALVTVICDVGNPTTVRPRFAR